jgi:cell division protein FtsB
MQKEKEELELEKLQAEVHKLAAETRKLIAETNKMKRETMFYPFVAAGGIVTVIVTAAAFIHKF